jgi:hypothetical protein
MRRSARSAAEHDPSPDTSWLVAMGGRCNSSPRTEPGWLPGAACSIRHATVLVRALPNRQPVYIPPTANRSGARDAAAARASSCRLEAIHKKTKEVILVPETEPPVDVRRYLSRGVSSARITAGSPSIGKSRYHLGLWYPCLNRRTRQLLPTADAL